MPSTYNIAVRWLSLSLWLGWAALCGAGDAPAAAREPQHFLFIVDTSASMKDRADVAALTVAGLIERGLSGRMQSGDVFGIWTYRDAELGTNVFPAQTWVFEKSRILANRAFVYVQKQKYAGTNQLRATLVRLGEALKSRPNAHVYLIDRGEQAISGTPFDEAVNSVWAENRETWRQLGQLAVTGFVIQNRLMQEYAIGVSSPPEPVKEVARGERPRPKPKPAPVTNAPPVLPPPAPVATNKPPRVLIMRPPTNSVSVTTTNSAELPKKKRKPKIPKAAPATPPAQTNAPALVPLPAVKDPKPAEAPKPVSPAPRAVSNTAPAPVPLPVARPVPPPSPPAVAPVAPVVRPTNLITMPVAPVTTPPVKTVEQPVALPPASVPARPLAVEVAAAENKPNELVAKPVVAKLPETPAIVSPKIPVAPKVEVEPVSSKPSEPAPAPVSREDPVPTNDLVVLPPPPPAVVAPTLAATPPVAPARNPLVLAGVVLMTLSVVIALLWFRRSNTGPSVSLITQSMERKKEDQPND